MDSIVRAMMELIASEACGKEIDPAQYHFSDKNLTRLFDLAKAHDLAHLVGEALIKNDLIENERIKMGFQEQILLAVYRYDSINKELDALRKILNEFKIPFLPLKGAVLRNYYPEPWMRTSCDIDILVHQKDLESTLKLLLKHLNGKEMKRTPHDVSFATSEGVSVELHYDLIEKGRIGKAEELLKTIWDYAACIKGTTEYALSDEMFYYYHLSHMAKHIEGGGCGVRPFLDLFLLNSVEHDQEKRNALLKSGGLEQFADAATGLAGYWFDRQKPNALILELENYILTSGAYGNLKNRAAVKQLEKSGKRNYIFSRIWLPYRDMVLYYPSLKGRKLLLPFYEFKRWCKLLRPSMFRRKKKELRLIANLSDEQVQNTNHLLKNLGIR